MRSIFSVLLSLVTFFTASSFQDFSLVKERVVQEVLKPIPSAAEVEEILESMATDGSFKDIDYSDLSRTAGFPHRRHTSDLVTLARAYRQSGTSHFHSATIKERIVTSLEYWVEHDFFGDNWHDNQISTPTNLVNLMLIIGHELPQVLVQKAQPIIGRAHMNASGARPSGDRIVIAGILAKNLLFIGDQGRFDEIIKLIEGEVKFSTGRRGIQHDFSFHHRVDRVNNTTSYGYGKYANVFGEWSYYVANTRYAFAVEKINHLIDYYLDGICKQLVYGIYEDISVKNRSISNQSDFKAKDILEIERLLVSTDYRKAELEEILRLRKGESKPSASFAKFFWQTEHFVFQRPDFYTTVRMYSTRNRNMEEPYNGPGKTTHHRADGTNYLQLKGDDYHDIWPMYDWQKISGTTIVQKDKLHGIENIQVDGLTDFVGAVTDGLYGAVAFDFKSPHDLLSARKSWFFFDEEYMCLGAGINLKNNLPVATTIDQVLMRSDISIVQHDALHGLSEGKHELENIRGVYHGSNGYVFPSPTNINISNRFQEGSWASITDRKNISEEIISKKVFTAWFDHGYRPSNESYAYLVIPNITSEEFLESCDHLRQVEIISNTPQLQAVISHKLNLLQAAFYEAGEIALSNGIQLQISSHGMVMLKISENRVTQLAIADPSRKLSKIILSLNGEFTAAGENFSTRSENERTTFIVDLPRGVYAGKSVVMELEEK